jgi:hypothetical protein
MHRCNCIHSSSQLCCNIKFKEEEEKQRERERERERDSTINSLLTLINKTLEFSAKSL